MAVTYPPALVQELATAPPEGTLRQFWQIGAVIGTAPGAVEIALFVDLSAMPT
jgi:hypothetical protein